MQKIALSGIRGAGLFVLVDDEDCEWLVQSNWALHSGGYAYRGMRLAGDRLTLYIHREIWERHNGSFALGFCIDHKNRNKLDNRKNNFRIATYSQNNANTVARSGTSNYKGVSWHKPLNKWRAAISINSKKIFLGYYSSENKAARAYDEAARKHFGEFAYTNF